VPCIGTTLEGLQPRDQLDPELILATRSNISLSVHYVLCPGLQLRSPQQSCETEPIVSPLLQARKVKFEESKKLAQVC
jgi:hypothetical protein